MSAYNAQQLRHMLTDKELQQIPLAIKEKFLDILERGHVQMIASEGLFEHLKERSDAYEVTQENFRKSLAEFGTRLDQVLNNALKIQELYNSSQKALTELRKEKDLITRERDELLKKLALANNEKACAKNDMKMVQDQLKIAETFHLVENAEGIYIMHGEQQEREIILLDKLKMSIVNTSDVFQQESSEKGKLQEPTKIQAMGSESKRAEEQKQVQKQE